ncbi:MAG: flagellar hook basal-body protein [Oscillospiraceae bacterium]|jgi:flagellar basal body rod protein FlgG|nr:flagellar hook basal-body protein [Oscillospiraceae bacterium]
MMNTGKSGMSTYQYDLDVIANNIANVETAGYKATKTSFRNLMFSSMDINKNREFIENNRDVDPLSQELTGRGVKPMGQDMLYTQGAVTMSAYQLDYAIQGDGLFAIDYKDEILYTRCGTFDISVEEDANYLVTPDGAYVLDWEGERIEIPYKRTEGGQWTDEVDLAALDPQIGMFTFDNPNGLALRDGTRFSVTEFSGEPQEAEIGSDGSLLLGRYLERSNVSIADEMSNLILTQRAYQFSARIVTTADEIEDLTNSLRA